MTVLAASANADVPTNVAENIGFGIIAAFMIFGALRVVTTRNVVHAALWLVLVLAGAAAQYLLLAAEFVAITQVLVYIGAIVVLFLFGIMLTKAPIGGDADLTRKSWFGGALVGVILLALLTFTLLDTWGDDRLPADRRVTGQDEQLVSNTSIVSDSIFSSYLIPFEAVSVLLTAALIGAIVIARKE
jgi:NADH-quinone oxidoreductase subunit J